MNFDKQIFFDRFRSWYKQKTKKKTLSVSVANAVDYLLDQFSQTKEWNDLRHISYAFATIAHETAWTFQPIKEYRAKAGTKGRANQDRYWLSGYYGRGYVQLTWLANYKKAAQKLQIDLVTNPSLALRADVAFKIMTAGMHEGWFTGKKLSDYINAKEKDYKNARKIINGLDKAATLASYAVDFELMLREAAQAYYANKNERSIEGSKVDKIVDSRPTDPQAGGTWVEEGDLDEFGQPVEEPIDNYPEEPKPGEAAPEDPAKSGEPVVGGRPTDAPQVVEGVEPKETSGLGAWASNIKAQWVALGIGVPSLGSLSFLTNPTFIYVAIGLIVMAGIISLTVYLTSMYLKSKEKREREERAHELTLKEIEINADPTKYNIKVV